MYRSGLEPEALGEHPVKWFPRAGLEHDLARICVPF